MAGGAGIRAQIAADCILQDEINRGLALLLAPPEGIDERLVRALARVVEASWAEHVSFQERVVFPLVAGECRGALGILMAIDRLRQEHDDLGRHHAQLKELLTVQAAPQRAGRIPPELYQALRSTLDKRRRHLDAEDVIADHVPPSMPAQSEALYDQWLSSRPGLPFPVGLLTRRKLGRRSTGTPS